MIKFIDNFLNQTTMYRLTLYCVSGLWLLGFIFSVFGVMHYNALAMAFSLLILLAVCFFINEIFAKVFEAPSNRESVFITAFILASIISPVLSGPGLYFLIWSGVLAMTGKYILAIGKKHLFNPAAVGVFLAAFIVNQAASWWMGTLVMAPFVLISGILICKKIKRFDLFLSFILTSLALGFLYNLYVGQSVYSSFYAALINSPALYLASIMLTEPMTTPPTRKPRIIYGILVGFLNAPFTNIFSYYFTPESALLAGNIFSYFTSSKRKLILKLKEKNIIADNTFDFIFTANKKFTFKPGQYLEWTLMHKKFDNRGIRRYFTIASSPTEDEIIMGVKFYDTPSTFKQTLNTLNKGALIVAGQLAGDFTLPEDKEKKLIFIAGGIGVTPFRSMIKYLTDKNEKRDIVMFYSNRSADDIAYKNVFDNAQRRLGIKTVYALTNTENLPTDWNGEIGMVNEEMVKKYVSDYKDRTFYISGPIGMINAFKSALSKAGIPSSQIKTDFFPGFA